MQLWLHHDPRSGAQRDRVGGIGEAAHRFRVEAVLQRTSLNGEQRAFVEARLLQISSTVASHVASGDPLCPGAKAPPRSLASFTDLYDYCDADALGGLADPAVVAQGRRPFPSRTNADTLETQGWTQMCDRIRALADEWIVLARGSLGSPSWQARASLLGHSELDDVDPPLGWMVGRQRARRRAPRFACGLYRLCIEGRGLVPQRRHTAFRPEAGRRGRSS